MESLQGRNWPLRRQPAWKQPIDLGGGRVVRPEDLLEGHYLRLAQSPREGAAEAQDVQVHVSGELRAAIRVVAPSLAPLTQVAEELASRITSVQPAQQFRSDLQRALEEEHRRRLAAGLMEGPETPTWAWVAAGVLTTLGLAGAVLWWLRRKG